MALKPPAPKQPGRHVFTDWDLSDLRECIDWTPFFRAWELAGTYPKILDDEIVGESARSLFADANKMLDKIVAEKWLTARAVVGLWPCARYEDDVVVAPDGDWTAEQLRSFDFLNMLCRERRGEERESDRGELGKAHRGETPLSDWARR